MRLCLANLFVWVAAVMADDLTWPGGALLTRGPYLQSCTSTSVVIRWRTDVPTDSFVYFESIDAESQMRDVSPVTEHEVRLTGLLPNTFYWYAVGFSSNILAADTNCYFRTSPDTAQPLRVWAIGDAGIGSVNQRAVQTAYLNHTNNVSTDVWLMLGDNVYGRAVDDEYQRFVFDIYPGLFRNATLWPALGNHDAPYGSAATYLNIFTLPTEGEAGGVPSHTELYYSYDSANVHFVCIDSWLSDRSPDGPMLKWLREDLAATTKDWIIAYWHHPPYSMGTDRSDSMSIMTEMRENVLPILEEHGVDLVLGGHSHVYERSFLLNGHYGCSWTLSPKNILNGSFGREDESGPYRKPAGKTANQGTVYMVCGNSGQGGYYNFHCHPAMAVKLDGYGSVVLDINGLRLDAKYLRPNGAIDDYFTIQKSAPPSAPGVPALNIARSTNAVIVSWPASFGSFTLEAATRLPSLNWQPVTNAVATIGGSNVVPISPSNSAAFLRLRSSPP